MRRPRGPRKVRSSAGDEPERHPQPAAARVGQREHRRAELRGRAAGPRQCGGPAGVDGDDGQVAVGVVPGYGAVRGAAVGEGDRHRAAADVVRVGQDRAVAEDDAGAGAPALPDAHDRGPGACCQLPDACPDVIEDRHACHLR